MTVLDATTIYQVCKRTGIDEKTVTDFLLRLERLRLNSGVDEDGNPNIISLRDASIEGYKMGLETETIERLYSTALDVGYLDLLCQEEEPEDEPEYDDEEPEEEPAEDVRESLLKSLTLDQREVYRRIQGKKKVKEEGYHYNNIAKMDVVRTLTNFGFSRRGAKNLVRRGVGRALEFLRSRYSEQSPLIQKQWAAAIGMLSHLNEREPKKDEKCKKKSKKK